MSKISQKVRLKEPVRLRFKSLANGNRSLYLDTYHQGKRSYEFLKLYLIPERTAGDKDINEATMRAAAAIKAKRTLEFINGKADIKDSVSTVLLQKWIEHIIKVKAKYRSISNVRLMERLQKHLHKYRSGVSLADVDRRFCIGFADYLRSAHALNSSKPLMQATQFELFNALSIILNEAVRAELIKSNPMRLLNASERIKKPDSTREYLTPEEVKSIIEIAADNIAAGDDVAAFLFCCFCGLRYSDVLTLTWENIVDTENGKIIITTMKKTHRRVEVPVSEKAASILPALGEPTARVFSFPGYWITTRKLKKITEAARIKKKLPSMSPAILSPL